MNDPDPLEFLATARAIASEGLTYAEGPFERSRFERLMRAVCKEYASLSGVPQAEIRERVMRDTGIVTPKIGVDVVMHRDFPSELLVLRRADDGLWCLPGGWVEVGESLVDAATRECHEETGVHVELAGVVAVTEKGPRDGKGIVSQANVLFAAAAIAAGASITLSHEHIDHRWIDTVGELSWHAHHDRLAGIALKAMDQDDLVRLPCPSAPETECDGGSRRSSSTDCE